MAQINWSATEIAASLVEVPPCETAAPENFSGRRVEFKVYPEWGAVKTRFVQEIASRIKGPVAYAVFSRAGFVTAPIPVFDTIGSAMAGTGNGDDGMAKTFADVISSVLSEEGGTVEFFGSDRVRYRLDVRCLSGRKDALGDVSDNETTGIRAGVVQERKEIRNEF